MLWGLHVVNRLALVALAAVLGLVPAAPASGGPRPAPEPQAGRTIAFSADGATFDGPWHADVTSQAPTGRRAAASTWTSRSASCLRTWAA